MSRTHLAFGSYERTDFLLRVLFDAICRYFWNGVGCHVFFFGNICQEVFNKSNSRLFVSYLVEGFNPEKYDGDHCSGFPIDSPCILSRTIDDPANS